MINDPLIFIVDDDKSTRRSLQVALSHEGFQVQTFPDPKAVMTALNDIEPQLLILDIYMGEISGVDLYSRLLRDGFDIPVIFMSGEASVAEAVRTVQMGAFDFLEKPFAPEKLIVTAKRCLELKEARNEIENLRNKTSETEFLGKDKEFQKLLKSIRKVAQTTSSVLITGESGTGKELIAREIHKSSKVSSGPFVKVNCAAIPENLVESEFFGHTKGAFTGAERNKKGYFEQAHGGTIFLDEIAEMSLPAQSKVLRAIQNMEIQKVGSEKITPVNLRIIAATNKNLELEVKRGGFREDLYYRLNVFPINAPALRHRKNDIPLLIEYFIADYTRVNGLPAKFVDKDAMSELITYDWPGNIRELKNVVERMAILGGQSLNINHIVGLKASNDLRQQTDLEVSLKEYKNKAERDYILNTLKRTEGNISEAASILCIERTYLHKKIQQHEIKKKEYFS